tara:strand:+ start:5985 stop:6593 length:609 start_codon:yes stop_codon:yes gene_type:complete
MSARLLQSSMLRRWLPSALLLVLAVATFIVSRQFDEAESGATRARVDTPDFFMERFVTTIMGVDGKPVRTIKAKELVHYPETNTKELEEPYMVMYQTGSPSWHIRSERGWISATGDVLLLLGAVHAWRSSKSGVRIIDIHTRDLRILPETDYGETDKPVTIATKDGRTVAMGMRAFLKESRLELMAQVKTQVTGHLDKPPAQ